MVSMLLSDYFMVDHSPSETGGKSKTWWKGWEGDKEISRVQMSVVEGEVVTLYVSACE
jgi:hypothetical protein